MDTYIGSEEERQDVIRFYNKCEGDMDKIQEYLIGFEEERTRQMIEDLIAEGTVEPFDNFVNEPAKKRKKREKKAEKEAKAAKKVKLSDENDLVAAIQNRNKAGLSSMLDALQAKYCKVPPTKGMKRKKGEK